MIMAQSFCVSQTVVSTKEKKEKWALVKGRKKITDYEFDQIRNRYSGYFPARLESKWGVLDNNGVTIIPFEYDDIEDLLLGRLRVKQSSHYGVIDTSGYVYCDIKFQDIDAISKDSTILVKENGSWFYLKNKRKVSKDTIIFKRPDLYPIYGNCKQYNSKEEATNCSELNMRNDIFYRLRYPKEAIERRVSGIVVISFVVSDEGETSQFKILRDIGYGCGNEAIRVAKKLTDWAPGIKDGEKIFSEFVLPIRFGLE
jgi:TonB family protein